MENENVIPTEIKTKKNKKLIFIIVGIIIILGLAVYFIYNYIYSSKNIIMSSIAKTEEQLSSRFEYLVSSEELKDIATKSYTDEGKMVVDLDLFSQILLAQGITIPADLTIDFKANNDPTNNYSDGYFKLSSNDYDNLGEFGYVYENENFYFNLYNAYDKLLKYGEKVNNSLTIEDLSYMYNVVVDSLMNNLEKQDFTSETVEIEIDGKIQKVYKDSLILSEERLKEYTINVLNDLKEDEKLNEILSEALAFEGYESSDDFWNSLIEEDDTALEEELIYNVYTKGITHEFIKTEIIINDTVSEIKDSIILDENSIIFYEGDEELLKIEFIDNDENMEIGITSEGVKMSLIVSREIETVTKNEEYNLVYNIELKYSGVEEYTFLSLNIDENIKVNSNIEKIDTSNAINMEDLTDEDTLGITEYYLTTDLGTILYQFMLLDSDEYIYEDYYGSEL